MPVPTLQDQLNALVTARALGEKRVTYQGKTAEYRDISELNAAISAVESDIAKADGGASGASRTCVIGFERGIR